MAWWTTQFIFRGDTLIAEGACPELVEGADPVPLDGLELIVDGTVPTVEPGVAPAGEMERYTRVIVSGYALYGELRGYYALGVAHWQFDPATGRVFLTETSQRHIEPVSSLTPSQRAIMRQCLINISPAAWETSTLALRRALEQ